MTLFGRIVSDNERKDKMTSELLPCPFCGGDGTYTLNEYGDYYVKCLKCDTEGPIACNTDVAIDAWNTRLTPKPLDEEALKAFLDIPFYCNGVKVTLTINKLYKDSLAKAIAQAYAEGRLT